MFLVCVLFLTPGCGKEIVDPKGTLEKQAVQYWTQRLVNKDYQYTYKEEMETDLPPFSAYEKQLKEAARIPTSLVTAKDAEIKGDQGIVTLLVTCRFPGVPKDIAMPMRDLWILKGNKWKHHFQIKGKEKLPAR